MKGCQESLGLGPIDVEQPARAEGWEEKPLPKWLAKSSSNEEKHNAVRGLHPLGSDLRGGRSKCRDCVSWRPTSKGKRGVCTFVQVRATTAPWFKLRAGCVSTWPACAHFHSIHKVNK